MTFLGCIKVQVIDMRRDKICIYMCIKTVSVITGMNLLNYTSNIPIKYYNIIDIIFCFI